MPPMRKRLQRGPGARRPNAALWLAVLAVLAALGFFLLDSYLPESGPFAGAEIDPASLAPDEADGEYSPTARENRDGEHGD